mmetsp:Transcript_11419/g.42649  ORF Transcript_11419/g.42649 Transcript_11419/m.42649 type:complete len:102 (+) Transcript_11419:1994-2299(+)
MNKTTTQHMTRSYHSSCDGMRRTGGVSVSAFWTSVKSSWATSQVQRAVGVKMKPAQCATYGEACASSFGKWPVYRLRGRTAAKLQLSILMHGTSKNRRVDR